MSLELKERAEAQANAQRSVDEATRHRSARDAFERTQAEVDRITRLVAAARSSGLAGSLEAAGERATALARHVADNVAELASNELQELAFRTEQAVTELMKDASHSVGEQISQWMEKQPRPADEFLRVLEASAPDEVRATRRALSSFSAHQEPSTPEGVAALADAATELKTSYEGLVAKTPNAVREFLERAPTGVPLSQIDEEVLIWLRANHADDAFTVRLR